jgi:peroxiredoxin
MSIAVGQAAPEFTLRDQDQNDVKLSDYRGKNVVILFYPLDWSPVCTDEHACFMSSIGDFDKLNAQVLGLSVDSTWSHKAFAEKMNVSYPLLADFHPRGAVADKFGVYHPDKGITGRAIAVIDKNGKVAWWKDYGFGEAPDKKEVAAQLAKLG